jgi:hypothetical protein
MCRLPSRSSDTLLRPPPEDDGEKPPKSCEFFLMFLMFAMGQRHVGTARQAL